MLTPCVVKLCLKKVLPEFGRKRKKKPCTASLLLLLSPRSACVGMRIEKFRLKRYIVLSVCLLVVLIQRTREERRVARNTFHMDHREANEMIL